MNSYQESFGQRTRKSHAPDCIICTSLWICWSVLKGNKSGWEVHLHVMYADVAMHSRKMLGIEGGLFKCDAKNCSLVRDHLPKSASASQFEFSNINQLMKFKAASLYAVPWPFNQQFSRQTASTTFLHSLNWPWFLAATMVLKRWRYNLPV